MARNPTLPRRAVIAASPGLLAGPALLASASASARAAGLSSTANFAITQWSLTADSITLHGSYPPPGTRALPKQFDYTLDGGRHWVAAGGFAMDSGAWDSWIYHVTLAPGTYTMAIRDHDDPARIAVAPGTFTITPNTAPAHILFQPTALSSALPAGFAIGTLIASGGTPHFPLVLHIDPSSPAITADPEVGGHWTLRVAPPGLRTGRQRLSGSIASRNQIARFAFDLDIQPGRRLDPAQLRLIPVAGLSNASPLGGKVFSLAMQGETGGSFSIVAQDAPADPVTKTPARYELTGAEAKNTNTLSAGQDKLTIAWSNGRDSCIATLSLRIADTIGHGPHLDVADPAALVGTMARVNSDPLGRYRGATISLAPGRYESGWLMPAGLSGWNSDGFIGPCSFGAAPGIMPVMRQDGAWILNGKGWLEGLGWDVDFFGLEFADLAQSYPGKVGNFAGIKLNAGVLGRTRMRGLYAHNCTNGVLGGQRGQIVSIEDSEFAKCGGGDGYTHNFYLADVTRATIRRVLSWGANVGHCGKIRAAAGLIEDCVFADGAEGCASYLLDLPDGGAHVVRRTIFEKGPYAQNEPLLRYGEECQTHHDVNTLLVEACVFINHSSAPGGWRTFFSSNGRHAVAVQVGLASGAAVRAVVRNCTFYGFTEAQATHSDGANVSLRLGAGNRFLPLSAAPAPASYMAPPYARLGYRSTSGAPGPYKAGPRAGH